MPHLLLFTVAHLQPERKDMMTLFAIIFWMALLDVAAHFWGVDSRDGLNSPEWERRQLWHGFH